jgi:choline dehydrogenase-like flavoprotein
LAKADARTAALKPLEAARNVTLLPGYKVLALKTDASGRKVTEVVASGPDGEVSFSADYVALAAGAANSAALLLKSANPKHPNGLANSSDQVGRNYMYHTTSAVISVALSHFDSSFPKTLCVNDFYYGDLEEEFSYPMGQIQMLEYMSGQTLEGQLADIISPNLIPDSFTDALAERMVSFLVISEDLPLPHNRVTLNENGGIKLSYTEGDLTAHKKLVAKLEAGLQGFTRERSSLFENNFTIDQELPLYGTAHQCGTVRMGDDPTSSVVDKWCKAHDLDNLYVVDASVFVSSAAVNPTLTIVANSLRVGDHLARQLLG